MVFIAALRGPPGGPLCSEMEPSSNDAGASYKKAKNYATKRARKLCTLQTLLSSLPIIQRIPQYNLKSFSCDLISGLTIALTVIPQGIGYAPLAGLPLQVPMFFLKILTIAN